MVSIASLSVLATTVRPNNGAQHLGEEAKVQGDAFTEALLALRFVSYDQVLFLFHHTNHEVHDGAHARCVAKIRVSENPEILLRYGCLIR